MPYMCCVPGCKGNYKNGPKVTVFNFPVDENEKTKWIHSIKRKDFVPSKISKVCELHFRVSEIQRTTSAFDDKNGSLISVPLKYPRLATGAVPSQFPNCPDYLTAPSFSRTSPDTKRLQLESDLIKCAMNDSLLLSETYKNQRKVESLGDIKVKLNFLNLLDFWTFLEIKSKIMFIHVFDETVPKIKHSVVVNNDCLVSVNINGSPMTQFHGYKFPFLVENINDLSEILDKVKSVDIQESSEEKTQAVFKVIIELLKSLNTVGTDNELFIKFSLEQFNLHCMKKNRIRYSSDILIFSSLLSYMAPHAYKFVRDSGFFILPHQSTLKRIMFSNTDPQSEQNENFLMYIKQKFQFLNAADKFNVLMMDEIHLKSYFDFKGGNIVGPCFDSAAAATSAHVFMVGSISSKYKDVVHILPVKSINANILHSFVKKIVIGLESIGFRIISVISDNNSINRCAMSMFCNPPALQFVYCHPVDSTRPLFFLLDSVHLLKCIRNNWVNQKFPERSMYYPKFDGITTGDSEFFTASLSVLEKMHQYESKNLLKYGYNVSYRALNPTSIEKQNVKLALQVFNENLVSGILEFNKIEKLDNFESTAHFIKIISIWWSIVNVKTPFKGAHKNNELENPLTYCEDDKKVIFLTKFLDWLDDWEKMGCTHGKLSDETHLALKITTYGLIQIALYCRNELNISYILPGKFQTDNLEARFSKYRQLGGAQYLISIRQVFEIEKKLRSKSLLRMGFTSKSFGFINIDSFDNTCDNDVETVKTASIDFHVPVSDSDLLKVEEQLPVIAYLGGYCVRNVVKKLKCDLCSLNLVLGEQCELPEKYCFIKSTDRGKLLYPEKKVIDAISLNYVVINKLCTDFEDTFLKCDDQRLVAFSTTFTLLIEREMILGDGSCGNGHSDELVYKKILWASTNTLLNNFCKNKNDSLITEAKRKRKEAAAKRKEKIAKKKDNVNKAKKKKENNTVTSDFDIKHRKLKTFHN